MSAVARHGLPRYVDSLGPWVALLLLAVGLGLGVRSSITLFDNAAWVDHTHRVIESLDDLRLYLSAAIGARRAFALSGDREQLDNHAQAIRSLNDATRRVRVLTTDNSEQQRRLDGLEPLLAQRIARMDVALARRARTFDPDREAQDIRDSAAGDDLLSNTIAGLVAKERQLLGERERRTSQSMVSTQTTEAAWACASLALMGAAVIRLRREVKRRERSERDVRDREEAITRLNGDLERRVEERTAQLEQANNELEAFSYSVVHDLRAPLRGMGGFAEVLLNEGADTLGPEARDSLREIHQNARQMALLIDALVAMSQVTREVLQPTRVDITALARAVARQLGSGQEARLPVVQVQDNLWADFDPSLARALLEILLGNSWKFTGKTAAPRIDVGSSEVAGETVLFVRDNGAGFDMSYSDKLFSPFGRLHTVAEFPGLGIGLATAKRILQRHGGRVWADGHVGEGAVFYFTLGPKVGGETT